METETQTVAAVTEMEPTNNTRPDPIELIIVKGASSGLLKIDERTGTVSFPEDLTFEQWREGLRAARTIKKKIGIVVADYIAIGVIKWGAKRVDEALEQLEMEASLVKTANIVTGLPLNLRFDFLDAEHYVELSKADITKSQKIRWARIASEQRLTPSQLKFSIIEGEVVDRAVARGLSTGIFTVQGIRQSFDVWHRRVGGLEGVKAMDLDHQLEIMEELEAVLEFATLLQEHLRSVRNEAAPNAA